MKLSMNERTTWLNMKTRKIFKLIYLRPFCEQHKGYGENHNKILSIIKFNLLM